MMKKLLQNKFLKDTKHNTWIFPIMLSIAAFLHFWLNNFSFELSEFNDRIIGISTFNKIDVAARLSQFYKAFFIAIAVFLVVKIGFKWFVSRFHQSKLEFTAIYYLSLSEIFMLAFKVFGYHFDATIILLLSMILFFLIIIPLKAKISQFKFNSSKDYLWLFILSFAANNLLSIIIGGILFQQFAYSFMGISLVLVAITQLLPYSAINIFHTLRSLVSVPLLFVFSQEIFLILNQHEIAFLHPVISTTILWVGIMLYQQFIGKAKPSYHAMNTRCLSIFVLGIIVFSTYHIQQTLRNDLFEIANSSNAMMSIFQYGKFPVADFLPTHLLSDFVLPVIYTVFNGYDTNFSYMAYEFLFASAYYFIIFKIVLRLSQNIYFALLSILFFPFFNAVFWGISSFPILLLPLAIYRLFLNRNFKSWLLLAILSVALIGWKPDVAILGIYGMIAGIILVWANKSSEMHWKKALIAFGATYGTLLLALVLLQVAFHFPVTKGISYTLGFFASSPQGRGLPVFAYQLDRIFYLQHVIYPIIIAIVLMFALRKFKRLNQWNAMQIISIVLFSIFYFANIQRGLTRHSFAERHDGFISSFAILSISLGFFLFKIKREYQLIGFLVCMSFLAIMFKFPSEASADMLYEKHQTKLKSEFVYSKHEKLQRVQLNADYYKNNVTEIQSFMKEIPAGKTFYDFSNTPALYYLTNREMPIYFIHSLAVTSESLQDIEVENLKEKSIPYLIFSHVPETYWDKTDGIHNAFRFYKISEYLYQNYSPHKTVGGYSIWKANDQEINWESDNFPKDTISDTPRVFDLKYLPWIWAKYDQKLSETSINKLKITESEGKEMRMDADFDKQSGNYVLVEIENPNRRKGKAKLKIFETWEQIGEFQFLIPGEEENERFVVRVSSQWNWYHRDINRIILDAPEGFKVKNIALLKAD